VGSPLSEALAAGDREAFAALYDRLGHRLFATARTMLDSTPEAEDVVHDLFVELVRIRQRLAAVADLEDRLAAGGFQAPPAAPPDDALAAAVAALPAAQREVVALKIDGGLTFAEIATVIGTSANTAASRYRYALEKLRACLTTSEAHR
jgi:RNA polymerase sigma-70 factor (ECF subfamily)